MIVNILCPQKALIGPHDHDLLGIYIVSKGLSIAVNLPMFGTELLRFGAA